MEEIASNDMSAVIIPKSDQISADDLIAGPITIRIASVEIRPGTEQPVSIHFEDDNGRPWKPCKSMSRVLVSAWGPDAKNYAGRDVTLYRDPTVKWGGMEVGGIRISHMSHLERAMTLALTATKGSRKPFVVKPLIREKPVEQPKAGPTVQGWIGGTLAGLLDGCHVGNQVGAIQGSKAFMSAWKAATDAEKDAIDALMQAAFDRFPPDEPLIDGEQEP